MRTGHRAVALAVIVAFYFALVGPRASLLLQSDEGLGRLVAVAVLMVPFAGVWLVWREARFGRATEELGAELAAHEGFPSHEGPPWSAAGFAREQADLAVALHRSAVETAPDDWAAWYRLGLAYDAMGNRSSGRAAMRHAVALHSRRR